MTPPVRLHMSPVPAAPGPAHLAPQTERQLLQQLEQTYERYEGVNHRMRVATLHARFSANPSDIAKARADEAACLVEISRLMDRMRALEGQLLKARGKLRPLAQQGSGELARAA